MRTTDTRTVELIKGNKKGLKESKSNSLNRIDACLSHKSDIWETPKEIYSYFMKSGYLDPCPINPNFDGLTINWCKYNFVNPPYSQLKKWVEKSIEEMHKGKRIVLLIPARTDTQAFKMLYTANARFKFITGRLKFSNKNSAPFPSMFVILDEKFTKPTFNLIDKNIFKEKI